MKKPIYVVEHLEKELWDWCLFEYEQASKNVGKENILFTNIKDKKKIEKFGKCEEGSVSKMNLDWKKVCVLDPKAEKLLTPEETDKFDYYIIGGILGEEEFNYRTDKELTRFLPLAEKRNLGNKQFTIDNAVYVTHAIVNGKKLFEIKMKDTAEIEIIDGEITETIELPYTYPIIDGKELMNPKLINYLKKKKGF